MATWQARLPFKGRGSGLSQMLGLLGILCRVGPWWAGSSQRTRPPKAKGGGGLGSGHVAVGCLQARDAEALARANLRQPEPSGLDTRGGREGRSAGAWRRTLPGKVRKDRCRRGGAGVNKNSGRAAKSFLLRPDPTGGSASQFAPNSPHNLPDARFCRVDAGGGRSHDVEALRNMMTEGWCGASGRAERECREGHCDGRSTLLN